MFVTYFYKWVFINSGWPSHLLLPRRNVTGQLYDLVVFLTNADEDSVRGSEFSGNEPRKNCRESLSFCGRLGKPYPDKKPMNYPFDRKPFEVPNPNNPGGNSVPVRNIEEYVKYVPNMATVQVQKRFSYDYIENVETLIIKM